MSTESKTEIEAAVFRKILSHLDSRKDVQNIDIMNLAGFCRNCLSKWYMAAAAENGVDMSYDEAREIVYGKPYEDWKQKYQELASDEKKRIFEETKPLHSEISGHIKG